MSLLDPKHFENSISGIRDLVKQIITLSTGIIALTITFSKDFIQVSNINTVDKYLIGFSWLLFLSSIICGVLALILTNVKFIIYFPLKICTLAKEINKPKRY